MSEQTPYNAEEWTSVSLSDGRLLRAVGDGLTQLSMGDAAARADLQPFHALHQDMSDQPRPPFSVTMWVNPYSPASQCVLASKLSSIVAGEQHFMLLHQASDQMYVEGVAMLPDQPTYYGALSAPRDTESFDLIGGFIQSNRRFRDENLMASRETPAMAPLGINNRVLRRLILGMNSYTLNVAEAAREQAMDVGVNATYRLGAGLLTLLSEQHQRNELPESGVYPFLTTRSGGESRRGFLIEDTQGIIIVHEPPTTVKSLSLTHVAPTPEGVMLATQYRLSALNVSVAFGALDANAANLETVLQGVLSLDQNPAGPPQEQISEHTPTEPTEIDTVNTLLARLISTYAKAV